jgi:hypothetical protein
MKTQSTPSPSIAEHSALPWKTERVSKFYGCYGHDITRHNGGVAERAVVLTHIATDSPEDRANAAFIVHAVNSVEGLEARNAELEGALEKLLWFQPAFQELGADGFPANDEDRHHAFAIAAARALLERQGV